MSDKTCGNCGESKPHEPDFPTSEKFVVCPEIGEYMEESWSDVCDGWHRRDKPERLEQRYEQLAAVARDLFNRIFDFNKSKSYFGGVDISDFRKRLEELGVEV